MKINTHNCTQKNKNKSIFIKKQLNIITIISRNKKFKLRQSSDIFLVKKKLFFIIEIELNFVKKVFFPRKKN